MIKINLDFTVVAKINETAPHPRQNRPGRFVAPPFTLGRVLPELITEAIQTTGPPPG